MKTFVKIAMNGQRFWIEVTDIIGVVDNDTGIAGWDYGNTVTISASDILDVHIDNTGSKAND